MATTFGERIKQARKHAQLSQAELARRITVKQQAIEYLENPKNNAQASRHTSEIARACGVDAGWLAKADGPAPGNTVLAHPAAEYKTKGQKHPASDAEKLLVLLRTFMDTRPEGKEELYAQALAVAAADAHKTARRTDSRSKSKRR